MIKKITEYIKDRISGKVPAGTKRSSHWHTVRKDYLEKHPKCQVCGGNKKLQVHHKHPFHLNPKLELDEDNLITLCEGSGINCHLTFGHLGNFKSFNANVEKDSKAWRAKIKKRP